MSRIALLQAPIYIELFRNQDYSLISFKMTKSIERLAVLIEPIQIPILLVKFSGDSQSGNTDNRLQKAFYRSSKGSKGNPD